MPRTVALFNGDTNAIEDSLVSVGKIDGVTAVRGGEEACDKVTSSMTTPEGTENKLAMAVEFDHMYIGCSDSKASIGKDIEVQHLKDLLLLHLDLIQQQAEQLVAKEKQIKTLRDENENLRAKLERMDRRVSLSLHKKPSEASTNTESETETTTTTTTTTESTLLKLTRPNSPCAKSENDESSVNKPGSPFNKSPTSSLTSKAGSPTIKTLSPCSKSGSPPSRIVFPGNKTGSSGTKPVSPCSKAVSPTNKSESPSSKCVSPPSKVASPCSKPSSPSSKTGSPSSKAVVTGIKAVSPCSNTESSGGKAESPFSKAGSPSKSTSPSNKVVCSKPSSPCSKPVSPCNKVGSPPSKAGSPPSKAGSPPSKAGSPPSKAGSPPSKAGSPPSKAGSPPSKAGSPPSKAGSPPIKVGSPSSKTGSPSSKSESSSKPGSPNSKAGSPCKPGSPSSKVGSPPAKVVTPSDKIGSPPCKTRISPSKSGRIESTRKPSPKAVTPKSSPRERCSRREITESFLNENESDVESVLDQSRKETPKSSEKRERHTLKRRSESESEMPVKKIKSDIVHENSGTTDHNLRSRDKSKEKIKETVKRSSPVPQVDRPATPTSRAAALEAKKLRQKLQLKERSCRGQPCGHKRGQPPTGRAVRGEGILNTSVAYYLPYGALVQDPNPEEECLQAQVEIPRWGTRILTSLYVMEGTENLEDEVFLKRHAKPEQDEKRRKRWDLQRMREQRHYERLRERYEGRQNASEPEVSGYRSLWPNPESAIYLHVDDCLPVCAFGQPMARIHPQEFALPWMSGRSQDGVSTRRRKRP